MKKLNNVRITTGAVLLTGLVAAPFSAIAADKVEFKFSGQVSRAITYANNGTDDDVLFVDNTNSGSRLRLTGNVSINPNLEAGVNLETQLQDNNSSSIDIGDADNDSQFQSRIREFWFKGGFGKVSLGQGDGAANGTSEVDFSGTTISDYSGNNLDDGISFADSDGNKIITNGATFGNFDGLSRNDRLRYDTPKLGPLDVAISVGQDRSELALRYSKDLGGDSKLGAALGYVSNDDADFKQTGLSASYITSGGFNLTGHYGTQDRDAAGSVDADGIYIKVGQKLGAHNVSLSWHEVNDLAAEGDEAERIKLAWVYHFKQGIDIFADFQNSSLDRTGGVSFEDVQQVSMGSRIKF